ncbi:MAG: hypothetical protein ACYTFY_19330, partial [Planctomycetota bacterium]
MKYRNLVAVAVLAIYFSSILYGAESKYEVGGPLAGFKLPAFARADAKNDEVELYPGSVEHFRSYWAKYCKVRSFYDKQSMLKNWVTPNLPGTQKNQVEKYAEACYRVGDNSLSVIEGKRKSPVSVTRTGVNSPAYKLNLGTLQEGLYTIRVIGAVPTEEIRQFRKPIYISLKVNDGLKGEINTYRVSAACTDTFHSVTEIYFHAPVKRSYTAELKVDKGSQTDLLIHNITLDDVLAGFERRSIKKEQTLKQVHPGRTPEDKAKILDRLKKMKYPEWTPEERLKRDEAIWSYYPPLNAQFSIKSEWGDKLGKKIILGTDSMTAAEIDEKYGKWEYVTTRDHGLYFLMNLKPEIWDKLAVNKKLGLEYTVHDLIAGKPLPAPYPFKEPTAGMFYPDKADKEKGRFWRPLGKIVAERWRRSPHSIYAARAYHQTGHKGLAHDAAVQLIRYAYFVPTLDPANSIEAVAAEKSWYKRHSRWMRSCYALWRDHYGLYVRGVEVYDLLYPYISTSQELADSVSRFIPWVK